MRRCPSQNYKTIIKKKLFIAAFLTSNNNSDMFCLECDICHIYLGRTTRWQRLK